MKASAISAYRPIVAGNSTTVAPQSFRGSSDGVSIKPAHYSPPRAKGFKAFIIASLAALGIAGCDMPPSEEVESIVFDNTPSQTNNSNKPPVQGDTVEERVFDNEPPLKPDTVEERVFDNEPPLKTGAVEERVFDNTRVLKAKPLIETATETAVETGVKILKAAEHTI